PPASSAEPVTAPAPDRVIAPEVAAPGVAPEAPEAPEQIAQPAAYAGLEVPAPTAGRLIRPRGRLARIQSTLGRGLLTALSRDRLDDDAWEEVEDTLLTADMGVAATQEIVSALRVRGLGVRTPDALRALLRDELLAQVGTTTDRSLATTKDDGPPAVLLVVGV